jgi:hypothetical protein
VPVADSVELELAPQNPGVPVADSMELELALQNPGVPVADSTELVQILEAVPNLAVAAEDLHDEAYDEPVTMPATRHAVR